MKSKSNNHSGQQSAYRGRSFSAAPQQRAAGQKYFDGTIRRVYQPEYNTLVKDDPNYHAEGQIITFHNQGTTLVRIDQFTLGPDDLLQLSGDPEEAISARFRIKFGADLADDINDALLLAVLAAGNKLVVTKLQKTEIRNA